MNDSRVSAQLHPHGQGQGAAPGTGRWGAHVLDGAAEHLDLVGLVLEVLHRLFEEHLQHAQLKRDAVGEHPGGAHRVHQRQADLLTQRRPPAVARMRLSAIMQSLTCGLH